MNQGLGEMSHDHAPKTKQEMTEGVTFILLLISLLVTLQDLV